jgi:hypothetical protein
VGLVFDTCHFCVDTQQEIEKDDLDEGGGRRSFGVPAYAINHLLIGVLQDD